jgi:hypothetical protein
MKHTVGLAVEGIMGIGGTWDEAMKAILLDTDRLDKRITQIQTGWLRFSLRELTTIVTSRSPDRNPISRVRALVESFNFFGLRQFMMMSGSNLYQLHFNTAPHPSKITPHDLHLLVPIIRTQCPKLVDLRLSLDFKKNGSVIFDQDISLPPSELLYGTGTIRKLTILAYNVPFDDNKLSKMFSFNLARNLACILAPGLELEWHQGPTSEPPDMLSRGLSLPLWGGPSLHMLPQGIRFFQKWVSSVSLRTMADDPQVASTPPALLHQSLARTSGNRESCALE